MVNTKTWQSALHQFEAEKFASHRQDRTGTKAIIFYASKELNFYQQTRSIQEESLRHLLVRVKTKTRTSVQSSFLLHISTSTVSTQWRQYYSTSLFIHEIWYWRIKRSNQRIYLFSSKRTCAQNPYKLQICYIIQRWHIWKHYQW